MPQRTLDSRSRLLLLLTLAAALAGSARASELRRTPIVRAVEKARPAVVNIHSEKTLTTTDERFGNFETSRRVNGMGTGVVVDERGYVITNHHVIDGVQKIRITLSDGSKHLAKLKAFDRQTDLALIKIEVERKLPVIAVGTSSDLMPG
ncbi:MAG: S1C family serine protease, partial [Planctomycetales bacterium]